MTALEAFAQTHRLRNRRDECGDPIIPGRRGQSQLYFDRDTEGDLCLMVIDGPVIRRSRWQSLGGKLWLGDISRDSETRKGVQDVKITGIPIENAKLAIRLAKVRTRLRISEAQREALANGRKPFPRKSETDVDKRRSQSVKPIGEPYPVPEGGAAKENEEKG